VTDHSIERRRSVLYSPGANARAMEKAAGLPADAVILDLEDAVAPDAKVEARERVCAATGNYPGKEVVIRVNAAGTQWHDDDIAAVATSGAAGVVVPKVGSAAEVAAIEKALQAAGAPGDLLIWAMVETPGAILAVNEIAGASERLAVLVMGTNDLVNELHAQRVPGRGPMLAALSLCVLAARAHGLAILDGVYNDVRDADGFADECRQGRAYGFDGKTLIHPSQVEPANEIWTPSADEVEHARKVVAAFDEALAQGKGVATVDGRMIENLHVVEAQRVLRAVE
jgi:citrate lyase subunit beta / citryl-CoA lyase